MTDDSIPRLLGGLRLELIVRHPHAVSWLPSTTRLHSSPIKYIQIHDIVRIYIYPGTINTGVGGVSEVQREELRDMRAGNMMVIPGMVVPVLLILIILLILLILSLGCSRRI